MHATAAGCWLFIVGSILFVTGGFINILQVVEAPSMLYMQLFNTTIAQFILGSGLFVVATVPYLWHLGEPGETLIGNFAAAQFLFASMLFFTGGVAIYLRKLMRDKLEAYCHASGLGSMFIRSLQSEIHDRSHFHRTAGIGADGNQTN